VQEAPIDGQLYGRQSAAWIPFTANYIPLTGGVATGNITIAPTTTTNATQPTLTLNKLAAAGGVQSNVIQGQVAGSLRWQILLGNASVEGVNNTGSDFNILRCGANGIVIDSPLSIYRSTGAVYINNLSATGISTTAINCGSFATNTNDTWLNNAHIAGSVNISINCSVGGQVNFTSGDTQCMVGWRYNSWPGYNNIIGFTWNHVAAGLVSALVDGGAVAYALANASDERLKQDIAPARVDCLDVLHKVHLYQYRWQDHSTPGKPKKVEAKADNLVPIGLVAQRLHAIAPWMARKPIAETKPDTIHTWDIDQNNLIALLIGAVQQLSARVGELEGAKR
jgi:hypothetical protein